MSRLYYIYNTVITLKIRLEIGYKIDHLNNVTAIGLHIKLVSKNHLKYKIIKGFEPVIN